MSMLTIWGKVLVWIILLSINILGVEVGEYNLEEIRLRDPFIVPVAKEGRYYIFGTDWRLPGGPGFLSYHSKDLITWKGPYIVFQRPQGFWADRDYWAPEVHHYRGKYYMFASFKAPGVCRGTQILASENPAGPYQCITEKPVTPENWECLDGTLYLDKKNNPWMVFCHEWVQVNDGEICAMPLSNDLKKATDKPILLFRASEAPWIKRWTPEPGKISKGLVTDGPFLYRISGGELYMLWSSFGKGGYKLALCRSESGELRGPWKQKKTPLYENDGGHGMMFSNFNHEIMLVLHQPNRRLLERPRLFTVAEKNGTLEIVSWQADKEMCKGISSELK